MKCSKCGCSLEDDAVICPECGEPVTPAAAEAEETPEVTTEQEAPAAGEAEQTEKTGAEAPAAPAAEASEAAQKKGKFDTTQSKVLLGVIIALGVAIVVLLGIIIGKAVNLAKAKTAGDPAAETAAETAEAADAAGTETAEDGTAAGDTASADESTAYVPAANYTHTDAAYFTDDVLDTVVASCGSYQITNRMLTYYYWEGFYTLINYFYEYYGSYVYSYLGLDPTLPLSEQQCPLTDDMSWDEYVMEYAMENIYVDGVLYSRAMEEGFELSEEYQTEVDNLISDWEAAAESYGYESADAYVQAQFGPYSSAESYQEYVRYYLVAYDYRVTQAEQITYTDEELNAWFTENAETMEESGIVQDDHPMVNIRHILIMPESVELEEGDEGYEEAVEAANAAAKAKAEEIYETWKSGEATEDSFAELAAENSEDTGSSDNGGLYENVYPGEMVTAFNDWCFDDSRKPGDSGILETSYGYHIMYYVSQTDRVYWKETVTEQLLSDWYNDYLDSLRAEYEFIEYLDAAAVYAVNLDQAG